MLYNTINKYIPRFVAVLLAVLLVFSMEVSAFAAEEIPLSGEEAGTEADENASSEAEEPEAERITSGSCGAGLEWSFSGGVLTVTGSGAMTDYSESNMPPWYPLKDEIIRIVLPEGMASVGSHAFYECRNISAVVIPSSVETIGEFAFTDCTGIKNLTIGNKVHTIGQFAFSNCASVVAINLPQSLRSVGTKAFYRCESITSITVPSGVTSIGLCAFGYCKNLVTANVLAPIKEIPEFMFYKCELLVSVSLPDEVESINDFSFGDCLNLNTVYYNGTAQTPDQIKSAIGGNVPGFEEAGSVTNEKTESSSSGTLQENGDGTYTQETVTVTPGSDSSVTTNVETTILPDTSEINGAEITITLNGEDGWNEAKDILEKELDRVSAETENVSVNIFVMGTEEIDSGFVELIAGKNVSVTIMTQDGSVWKINGKDIDAESETAAYNLAYELSFGDEELSEELGTGISFVLRFLEPAEVNAEVLIRIGPAYAKQNATLFQKDGELKRLQSAVVDNEGYAHFYLASVTEETEYYIAMNLPDAQQEAIIPENMLADYGNPEYTEPIRYEITGRTSSWGMNLGQVMGILAAVMVTVIVVVGVTMFVLNKRKLKAGYVPQWEDDEE